MTITPVVFFGNLRSAISSLFKSLIEIFKLSTLIYLLVSNSTFFYSLNSAEDSNLPNNTLFETNF